METKREQVKEIAGVIAVTGVGLMMAPLAAVTVAGVPKTKIGKALMFTTTALGCLSLAQGLKPTIKSGSDQIIDMFCDLPNRITITKISCDLVDDDDSDDGVIIGHRIENDIPRTI